MNMFRKLYRISPQLRYLIVLLALIATAPAVRAEESFPEGTLGWTYYVGSSTLYAKDPVTACAHIAKWHYGTALADARPDNDRGTMWGCKYPSYPDGEARWHAGTLFQCKSGYTEKGPGICTKMPEPLVPLSCEQDSAGVFLGNPVQLVSGDKIQRETDVVAGPLEPLQVSRTYRMLRQNGLAQSGGFGWSFSFDRSFTADFRGISSPKPTLNLTLADGSPYEFLVQPDGTYKATGDRYLTLTTSGPEYANWFLTSANGDLEHYTKINDAYKLVEIQIHSGKSARFSYSPDGQLTMIADNAGRALHIKWDRGHVISIEGENGGVSYEYERPYQADIPNLESGDRLATVRFYDKSGRTTSSKRYHYEHNWLRYALTGITDENGARFATYAYNDAGQAILSEHADGAERYVFTYTSPTTRAITDPNGTIRTIELERANDGKARIVSESQPGGAGCSAGASSSTFSTNGDLESTTDFNGVKACFQNDPERRLPIVRISGLAALEKCPAPGQAASSPARYVTTKWHPDWRLPIVIAGPTRVETNVYNGQRDAAGRLITCAGEAALLNGKPLPVLCLRTTQATTDADGHLGLSATRTGPVLSWSFTYDTSGRMLTRTAPPGASGSIDKTSFGYYTDATPTHKPGDLATSSNGAGEVTRYLEYNDAGVATKIQLPGGLLVAREYDSRQLLTTNTIAAGGLTEITRYSYDLAGQLVKIVQPDGSSTMFEFDRAHRLTDVRDGASNSIHFTLDGLGNAIREEFKGASGNLVFQLTRSFDSLNRLQLEQRSVTNSTSFYYDRNGNMTSIADAAGRKTAYTYDSFNRLVSVLQPTLSGGPTAVPISFAYSRNDDLVAVSDSRGLRTNYGIDGLGRTTRIVSPDTGTTNNAFSDSGDPVSTVDAAGRKTAYRFDAQHRLTQLGSATFEYGANGTPAAGQLTRFTDRYGETKFAFDAFSRIQTKVQTVGTGTTAKRFTTAYTYGSAGSAAGHIESITYPSGNRIQFSYSVEGRASAVTLTRPGASPLTLLSDIKYQPFGGIRSWLWGNSKLGALNNYEREFDTENRVAAFPLGHPAKNGVVRRLVYDATGRVIATVHTGAAAAANLNQKFEYDELDRLIGFNSVATTQNFKYDPNDNRTSMTLGSSTYLSTIQASSNRLLKNTGPAPAKNNAYDASGNLTSDGIFSYTYGEDGRLSAVTGPGGRVEYGYNGVGERVVKQRADSTATYYVYDQAGRVLGEYDSAGLAIQETIYLDGVPVAVVTTTGMDTDRVAGMHYVYADQLGTPRILTRAKDNAMVWRWDAANPFGEDQPIENPSALGKFTYNLRFPGQLYDKETNNHYNYYRDYDPQTGRYIQSDPIGLNGGINPFAYVGGNPVGITDASGLAPRRLDPSSQECVDLAAKIRRKSDLIAKLGRELDEDTHRLPLYPSIPNLPAKMSRIGHAERLEQEIGFRQNDIQLYNDKCGPPPPPTIPPEPCPLDPEKVHTGKNAAKAVAGAGALYWIISEGSRIFLPRNLIPVP
jgi:RHS repeat-associated protein